jgi:hypothetical protein
MQIIKLLIEFQLSRQLSRSTELDKKVMEATNNWSKALYLPAWKRFLVRKWLDLFVWYVDLYNHIVLAKIRFMTGLDAEIMIEEQ